MTFDTKDKIIAALLAVIAAMAAIIHFSKGNTQQTTASQQWNTAPTLPATKGDEKVAINPFQVKVLPPSSKKGLQLPKATQDDPKTVIVDTAKLPPSDNSRDVAVVLNTDTGDTSILSKDEPAPWFSVQHRSYIELDYGYQLNNFTKTGQLSVSHDFLRVKDITLVGTAAVNNLGVGSVLVGLRYAF